MKFYISVVFTSLLLTFSMEAFSQDDVPYPDGYRQWFHVKTMLIKPGHPLENPFQGLHHIYANKKAQSGLKTGNYADGSVFVFDLHEYLEKDKTIQQGERKLVGVMSKNMKKHEKTGGWGFEGFAGDSKSKRLVSDGGQSCYSCHTSQKENGYVFTRLK